MPHINSTSSKPAIAALSLVLTALALAACGSSSTSSSPTTNAAAAASTSTTAPTTSTPTTGAGTTGTGTTKAPGAGTTGSPEAPAAAGGHFAALRACLAKNGVKLPQRKPGQRPGAGGFSPGAGGASGLPAGVTRSKFEAAVKKCGGLSRGRFPGAGARFNSPAVKASYTKFAACMRENGVNLPPPNTSGKGPVFNDKDLKLSSPTFRAAERKCRSILFEGFRARPGGAAAPPAG
jgi:hypothetical protein